MSDTRVKGVALAHFREFVLERLGEKGLDEVAATLSPTAAKMLTSPAGFDWYELGPVIEIEHALVKRLFDGDIKACAELGEYDVDESINKIYRILFRLLDPATLIKKSGQLSVALLRPGRGPRRAAGASAGAGPHLGPRAARGDPLPRDPRRTARLPQGLWNPDAQGRAHGLRAQGRSGLYLRADLVGAGRSQTLGPGSVAGVTGAGAGRPPPRAQ
ncbi:MAG: hypothetical protein QM765_26270 [Myxococcales bacterium]